MQPKKIDLLLHCQWLIPVIPEDQLLENHCVAVDEGKIIAVLPISSASQQFDATEEVKLDRHIVLPGLINTHSYSAIRLLRNQCIDCTGENLLETQVRAVETQLSNPDFTRDSLNLATAEMIKTGTTCFADLYLANHLVLDVLRNIGMRSQLSFMLSETQTAFGKNADDYIHRGLKLYDDVGNHSHIKIACAPYDSDNICDSVMQRTAVFANELDLPIHVTHQGATDNNRGEHPLERLFNLGLLRPETLLAVGKNLSSEDIALIDKTNSNIALCAQAINACCDNNQWIAELLQTDINLSLGTEGAVGNNFNLFAELKPLTQTINAQRKDISLTEAAHLALRIATINGAKALGWSSDIGSVEAGKFADIIAVEIDSIAYQPLYNPLVQLTHSQEANQVTHSWVAGKALLKDRKLQNLNEQQLIQSAKDWCTKLAE